MSSDFLLADDLSGALEAGAAFRARGRRVTLQLGPDPDAGGAATLQLYSTETRNLSGPAAAALVRRVLRERRAAGARLVFKKIDSTLRGPVAAELAAVRDELAPPLLVLCPATPAAGRTVRDGLLLVGGTPVAQTEFARDPGSPVAESRVAACAAAAGFASVTSLSLARLRGESGLAADERRGLLASDAETDEDLARLVALVQRQEPAAVFVGAGGLAHAVARAQPGAAPTGPAVRLPSTGVLIVSASRHERSRRQLEWLRDRHGVPLIEFTLADGTERATAGRLAVALAARGCAALTVAGEATTSDPAAPVRGVVAVAQLLGEFSPRPEVVAVTGGETARALCAAFDLAQLELLHEIEPGVVVTATSSGSSAAPRYIVIKPGGFGSLEVWTNLVRQVQSKAK
ncbi:MAG TPA: four-carbon acid sugar kinase family protein [Lacunisphaera sp.]|nr:four-carbon acid sugar kinase family protein [Lacunisphaera sp.]